jgi:Flp pilus assembly protein TadD
MKFEVLRDKWILAPGLALALMAGAAAQQPGAGAGGGAPTGGGGASGGSVGGGGGVVGPQPQPGGRPTQPGRQPQDQMNFPEMQRMIYLTGKVVMDDGSPPPESVLIERVCNGNPRPEGYTDQKGRFSFQLGQNNQMLADASVSNTGDIFDSSPGSRALGMPRGLSERDLMGCEIRASLAGFRSDVVTLAGRRALDNPDVGTIVLRRMAKVDGFTFSGTSAYAPKDARKAYEKGRDALKKKKLEEAEKQLSKAVELYPKYAVAWFELGMVHQMNNKIDDARQSYAQSLKADEKYVNPYAQLALLAAAQQKWDETIDWSAKLIKLNPYHSPHVYFYHAMANLNTKHLDEAETSAREAVKLDQQNKLPRTRYLLGVVLAQKGNLKESAEMMRSYLDKQPNAQDAPQVREQLSEIERQLTPVEAKTKQP